MMNEHWTGPCYGAGYGDGYEAGRVTVRSASNHWFMLGLFTGLFVGLACWLVDVLSK